MNDLIVGTHVTGEINMNGKSILSHDIDVAELRRHVGMVFQKPNPSQNPFIRILFGVPRSMVLRPILTISLSRV